MIRRLYIHNFRCLENFELKLGEQSSVLLIGKNGSGKSSVRQALEILQAIARGKNRVRDLVTAEDFTRGRNAPMRFEIEVELQGNTHEYVIAFELPSGFKELRVFEEKLAVNGQSIYSRTAADIDLGSARFRLDWHLAALPVIQERSQPDHVYLMKKWLARMMVLRPIPQFMTGHSARQILEPNPDGSDFADWFSGVLANSPSSYGKIEKYLKQVMPELEDIQNPKTGEDSRTLVVQFSNEQESFRVPFARLSDGEKCFVISALVQAAAATPEYDPAFCFWDEPDTHLAMDEIGHFIMTLRRTFRSKCQFIATSHNPEAIHRFSDENTRVLQRNSQFEPAVVRKLSELQVNGDLIGAIVRGDVL